MTREILWKCLCLSICIQVTVGEYVKTTLKYACPDSNTVIHPCRCVKGGNEGLTVSCFNSNLASLSVGIANLGSLKKPVEFLEINSCNISNLYGGIFYTLNLKKLLIKNVPLVKIEEDVFLGSGRYLKQLSLEHTRLSEFPEYSLKNLVNLTSLTIDTHNISSLSASVFNIPHISNNLEHLTISNGLIKSIPSDVFESLKQLNSLDMHGNRIEQLQKNQFKGLRELVKLDISFNAIRKLDSSHFSDLAKLAFCNISHNDIGDLPRGTFARNAVLRSLNLSYNKLRKIDANMFRGMRLIRRLYLSDNEISTVDRGTFAVISRIGTIDLARNKIEKIDYQMFFELRYVENIDVSENKVTAIEKLAFKSLYLVDINLSKNSISNIQSGAFEDCANITRLDLSHNNIEKFDNNSFDEITYVTDFQLSHNLITDLSHVPLSNMTGLKILNVTFNKIIVIPKNTFPKLYELHTIDLSNNYIKEIYSESFQPLFGLRSLNLSDNSLENISSRMFGKVHTLFELYLNNNKIRSIAKEAFVNLASLRTLDVSNNEIEGIFQIPIALLHMNISNNYLTYIAPEKTWPSMNTILTMDLSNNLLGDSLQKGTFSNLLVLQDLNLAYNGITELSGESFKPLSSLNYLNLKGNNLTALLTSTVGSLPVLFDLNLSENQIEEIEDGSLMGVWQLRVLNLSKNNLSNITSGAFKGLVALEVLDLSQNLIETLDNKTHSLLEECTSLRKLNVSNNRISFLSRHSLPSHETLRIMDCSYNNLPVLTPDAVPKLRKIPFLNFSHNAISEIRQGVVENLTSLVSLDLSFNELSSFTFLKNANFPTNLTWLKISNNRFTKLPMNAILKLKSKLKFLDVSANKLMIYPEIASLVENGTEVLYEGNDVKCDCLLRPLRRFLSSAHEIKIPSGFSCDNDGEAYELMNMTENMLHCQNDIINSNSEYDLTPDIKFREITKEKDGSAMVTWFVNKNKEDIADFVLELLNTSYPYSVFYKTNLPYFMRSQVLPRQFTNLKMDVCITAMSSAKIIRKRLRNQCKHASLMLPNLGVKLHATLLSFTLMSTIITVTYIFM